MVARRPPYRRIRQGFTLIEVLLTLALLVMITALVWPALGKPFANQRLRRSAERIRVRWSEARIDAMSSGRIYTFRYLVGGDRFRVQCQADLSATADELLNAPAEGQSGSSTTQVREASLPFGVMFLDGEIQSDATAALIEPDNTPAGGGGEWSEPILFYPDGTTSTAAIRLKNEHGHTVELSLRGLTGVGKIGSLCSTEEAMP